MKYLLAVIAFAAAGQFALAPVAQAATPQPGRMSTCKEQAGDREGAERTAFMKSCLSAGRETASTPRRTAQQDRMKSCNAKAGKQKLKGDKRKAFMRNCLKG